MMMEIDYDFPVDVEMLPAKIKVLDVKGPQCEQEDSSFGILAEQQEHQQQEMPSWLAKIRRNVNGKPEFTAERQRSNLSASVLETMRSDKLSARKTLRKVEELLGLAA